MAENKKYYFLKLKEDFFDQREIVVLEGSKDGVLYVNILLKLYLKSLQHDRKLLLNEMTPLSAEMIALLTRHEIGTVERAMRAFIQLGLVEVLEDNTYYMPEIREMTGKGSSDAERKARYRRLKAEGNTPLLADKKTDMGQNWDALVNKNWTLKLYFFTYNLPLLYSRICFPVLPGCKISQRICRPFFGEKFYICSHFFLNIFSPQVKISK